MFKAASGYLNTIKNLGGVIWQFNVERDPGRGLQKNGENY